MTENILNPQVQLLCILAQDDLAVLSFALPDAIYGFHAQQSCEKFLKALISAHNRKYPRTHSLKELGALVQDCGETIPPLPFLLSQFDPYAVQFRYDALPPLSRDERALMQSTATILRDFVLARVLTLQQLP